MQKKKWISKLIDTYETHWDCNVAGNRDRDSDIDYLLAVTTISFMDWFLIKFPAALLLGVPLVLLAFLTGFSTSEIGLSCRSPTCAVCACSEFPHVLLWPWAYGARLK